MKAKTLFTIATERDRLAATASRFLAEIDNGFIDHRTRKVLKAEVLRAQSERAAVQHLKELLDKANSRIRGLKGTLRDRERKLKGNES